MRPKLLYTASTYSHLYHFHLPYIRAFRALGWEVDAACGGASVELPGVRRTIDLPFEKKMTARSNFEASKRLCVEILQERYDMVSTHTSLASFFTRWAVSQIKKRPIMVSTSHGYLFDANTPFLKRTLLAKAERLVAPQTDLLMTMNRWDDAFARRRQLGKQIVFIPGMGVDFSRFDTGTDLQQAECLRSRLGFSQNDFLFICAAEFSARKSQAVLIRALPGLPGHVRLLLPGEGALRSSCQALARELGVEDRVVFPGYVSDIPVWYRAANAAISASRSEGLPFHMMEAMYSRLPVVASAVKGHVDLIRDGETGLLFPYGDAAACARKMALLAESTAYAGALAGAAFHAVQQYRLEEVLPAVMSAYAAVCPRVRAPETADAVS